MLTYRSAPNEFNNFDVTAIVILLIVFWLFIIGLIWLFKSIFGTGHWIINVIASGLSLVGIYSLNLSLNDYFIALPVWQKSIFCIAGFFIIFTMMKFFDENKARSFYLNAVLAIAVVWAGSSLFSDRASDWFSAPPAGKTSAKNVNLVTFNQKPNVYLVSFDSLQPRKLVKKYLDIDGAAYHDILDEKFSRFKNFFADRVPTRASLNSLLALDMEHYDAMKRKAREGFFQGKVSSPLFEIFKHNNYVTNTFYISKYFGTEKGPFIDNYYRSESKGACEFIEGNSRLYAFFGYCKIDRPRVQELLGMSSPSKGPATSPDQFLISKMAEGLSSPLPHVFLGYIYLPGHTQKDFNYDNPEMLNDYRQFYEMRSKLAKRAIERLVNFIDENDPNAILYVFGDHGPWLSRREKFSKNAEFFIQDRHGVYGGIYPKDRCENELSKYDDENFTTTSKIMINLLRCLTNEEVPSGPLQYKLPVKEGFNYEQYLYE